MILQNTYSVNDYSGRNRTKNYGGLMSLISVIVPVYNAESYLCRCVDSILSQTHKNIELLLVDDGSTDTSGVICDQYGKQDNRVHVFHQSNRGQGAARNTALDWLYANSSSQYITFIDSDDVVHPQYIELLYDSLRFYGNKISQCLYTESNQFNEFATIKSQYSKKSISTEDAYTKYYCATVWAKMFHRDCLANIRFPEGIIYEDVAIWYKVLFAESHISLVEENLYFYFINSNSTVRSNWTPRRLAQVDVWKEQIRFLYSYNNRNVLMSAISRYYWVLLNQIKDIKESNSLNKRDKKKYIRKIRKEANRSRVECKDILSALGKDFSFFEIAYPKLARLYQLIKGRSFIS